MTEQDHTVWSRDWNGDPAWSQSPQSVFNYPGPHLEPEPEPEPSRPRRSVVFKVVIPIIAAIFGALVVAAVTGIYGHTIAKVPPTTISTPQTAASPTTTGSCN